MNQARPNLYSPVASFPRIFAVSFTPSPCGPSHAIHVWQTLTHHPSLAPGWNKRVEVLSRNDVGDPKTPGNCCIVSSLVVYLASRLVRTILGDPANPVQQGHQEEIGVESLSGSVDDTRTTGSVRPITWMFSSSYITSILFLLHFPACRSVGH